MMAGLSLITAAIVHRRTAWTVRLAPGTTVPDLAHVAPPGRDHIGLAGDQVRSAPDPAATRGTPRLLTAYHTILNKSYV
jgi:hypothetical protein